MSRNEAPAPDGQPTHQTRVIVTGLTHGSPEYIAAMTKHQGPLNHFISKNHQYVALSGLPVHKQSAEWGGATATYQNINGQTQVVLDLTAEYPEGDKSVDSDAYWRWAIIELIIPSITSTSAQMAAFLNPKDKKKIGVAHDNYGPLDLIKPPLAYAADLGTYIADVADNNQISSLRVDLRPYPGGVKFDLYGYIHRYIDSYIPGPVTGPALRRGWTGANSILFAAETGTITQNGVNPSKWLAASDVSGRTQMPEIRITDTTVADITADFPALVGRTFLTGISSPYGAFGASGPSYAGISVTWNPINGVMAGFNTPAVISAAGGLFTETTTFNPDGITYMVRGLGAMDYYTPSGGVLTALNGAGPIQASGNYGITCFDYTLYYVGTHPSVAHYAYQSRDVPVKFSVMDDAPDGWTNRFNPNVNSTQWERVKVYPKRWKFLTFPKKAHIPSYDPPTDISQANHFGLRKIGTVVINPRKGKGGIKFTPA